MDYIYSDRFGETDRYQRQRDTAADKGLLQVQKEDRLPFKKLIEVLRKEMIRDIRAADRALPSPCEHLSRYKGTSAHANLATYWVCQ